MLDLDTNDDIDVTTADQLIRLRHSLDGRGITLCLARVHAPTLLIAQRAGLIQSSGSNHVFPTIGAAIVWATDGQRRTDERAREPEVDGAADV